jgi:4-cresol dehydrogenase (hydroxylating)
MMSSDLESAIASWESILGSDGVAHDQTTLDEYGRNTQADAPQPGCILYPTSTQQVQEIAKTASQFGIVVYPISCGKNWGYGDACAPSEGAAIVDLGRMNRIVEVNTDLAYCVIEPGVTQQQLYDYLHENDTGLWMDATAAGPDSSLVGNTADRGFGHTRYGDHVLTCGSMEIVLADGRVLDTGFGHFGNAKAEHCYPYGVGPFMNGLFTQSNYGIITKIGLWLIPEPEEFNFFYFQLKRFEDFEEAVNRLRPLKLNGTLDTAIHIGNDFRVLAGSSHYPWEEADGQTPLPHELRMKLRERSRMHPWQASGSISGSKGVVRAGRKALRKALRGLATPRFLDDRKLAIAEAAVKWANRFGLAKEFAWKMEVVRPNYNLLKGIPAPEPLYGAQWRLRKPPEREPGDPLDFGVGLYWVSPVMPMEGADAMNVLKYAEPIFTAHGFDMVVSFILLTERCLVAIFNVAFDKSVPEECRQASECYDRLVDTLMAQGYPIYRAGLQGMDKIRANKSTYWDVATAIKKALDPEDIIARGRYIPPIR